MRFLVSLLASAMWLLPARAGSFYRLRPDDPRAVSLTAGAFGARGDGIADDTAAIQRAIDSVQERTRQGILFISEGRYRITHTLCLWNGIRLIGYGAQRPVFLLGPRTPGYQTGRAQYMLQFAADRPLPGAPIRDANGSTFYSAISNIDFEIGDQNPAAIAIRFHAAQHCFLSHMDFRTGSGRAALEDIGNQASDLRFEGGDYGIITHKTAPTWQFLLMDSLFEGQRVAAIQTEEAGLTLIRDTFRRLPSAVVVNPDRSEQLYMRDAWLEDLSEPAIVLPDGEAARLEVNIENAICVRVPRFARFRTHGNGVDAPGPVYQVRNYSHGLHVRNLADAAAVETHVDFQNLHSPPAPPSTDIAQLPAMQTWANIKVLGAKGDGVSDDTQVFRDAIARFRTIYLPSGRYRVTDSLILTSDTALIGLNPATTQIVLLDRTPAYSGDGPPKALLEAPGGGTAIVSGIGLSTGGINPRAVALHWMARGQSLVDDVRFLGGHGTYTSDGLREEIYNNNQTSDPDVNRKWDSGYWSLWVDGGGGVLRDIWTPNPFAQAGLFIGGSDGGTIYQLSSEHHVRNELIVRDSSHWRIYGLQTEEEKGEGPEALPVALERCRDILFANLFLYRVSRTQTAAAHAIVLDDATDIRFRNVHSYSSSKFAFDNTVFERDSQAATREQDFATLALPSGVKAESPSRETPLVEAGARIQRVAGGFHNLGGMVANPHGDIYFTDPLAGRIYRWSVRGHHLAILRDNPPAPAQIALERNGNVLVLSDHETACSFSPGAPQDSLSCGPPRPFPGIGGRAVWLPANLRRDPNDFLDAAMHGAATAFVSPDGTTAVPVIAPAATMVRASGLVPTRPGQPVYMVDEVEKKTFTFELGEDGSLTHPRLFAYRGETAAAVDAQGNVFVADGRIFVYDAAGALTGTIEVPERPASLVFGGPDGKTLFIGARSSLYSIRTLFRGRDLPEAIESETPQNLQLFLLIGQSNMAGRGVLEPGDHRAIPGVFALNRQMEWVPAADPVHFDKPQLAGVGPALSFAETLEAAAPGASIGLIPAAYGGSSLDEWRPGGALYAEAVRRARIGMRSGKLRGILWHQGEADSERQETAESYAARWAAFVAQLRADLGAPDIPVIAGQLGEFLAARPGATNRFAPEVNEQLTLLPQQVSHTAVVSSAGLTSNPDRLHFDARSERELGRRYALEFLHLVPEWRLGPL